MKALANLTKNLVSITAEEHFQKNEAFRGGNMGHISTDDNSVLVVVNCCYLLRSQQSVSEFTQEQSTAIKRSKFMEIEMLNKF